MRMYLLAAAAALLAAAPLAATEPQVQVDVVMLKCPTGLLDRPEIKYHLSNLDLPIWIMPAEKTQALICALRKAGASVLAEPRLVTNGGRKARFHSGGQVSVPVAKGEMQMLDVGTVMEMKPTVRPNGRIYLEFSLNVTDVCTGPSVETKLGNCPGISASNLQSTLELNSDETLMLRMAHVAVNENASTWKSMIPCMARICGTAEQSYALFVFITPHLIATPVASKPARSAVEERAAKAAAKLVAKYHDACARGETEKARKYARQALDFDPACFEEAAKDSDPNVRIEGLRHQSEDLRKAREEWRRIWSLDQPSHLTPERVHGGIQ